MLEQEFSGFVELNGLRLYAERRGCKEKGGVLLARATLGLTASLRKWTFRVNLSGCRPFAEVFGGIARLHES